MRLCGYVVVRLCGCAVMWLCGYGVLRLCGYAVMRFWGCEVVRLCGYVESKKFVAFCHSGLRPGIQKNMLFFIIEYVGDCNWIPGLSPE